MQTAPSKIWTHVIEFTSYEDNRYAVSDSSVFVPFIRALKMKSYPCNLYYALYS